eukprot:19593-Chlamydomonas_euryale.AAC.1
MPTSTREPISSMCCPAAFKLPLFISTLMAEWPTWPAINVDMPPVHCGCTGVQGAGPATCSVLEGSRPRGDKSFDIVPSDTCQQLRVRHTSQNGAFDKVDGLVHPCAGGHEGGQGKGGWA